MAKKQTFGDKLSKNDNKNISIKLIRSKISDKTGSIRFYEDLISVPEGNGLGLSLNKDIFQRKDVVIRKSS